MQLLSTRTISHVRGYGPPIDPPPPAEADRSDVGLTIHEAADPGPRGSFFFVAHGPKPLFPSGGLNGWIPLTRQEVFEIGSRCRETWRKKVVELSKESKRPRHGHQNDFPFKEGWDFAGRPDLLEGFRKELAEAGDGLFYQVFGKGNDKALAELARILKGDTRLNLRITSDSFYVPWGLVYTHPSGSPSLDSDFSQASDCGFGGFWGIRHIIQHKPTEAGITPGRLEAVDGKLPMAAYVDDEVFTQNQLLQLDKDWEHLAAHLRWTVRRKRSEFRAAFGADPLVDRLTYFFCHGFGADEQKGASTGIPKIVISPEFEIDRLELENLRKDQPFRPPPFIFINACQGGQVSTLFYKSVAEAFLKLDAMGIIGPQIDIPAKFAAEYAKRFLGRLVNGSNDGTSITIGSIVRDLAEEFVQKHKNPLGLVYSLYYGGDCQVDLGIKAKVTTDNDPPPASESG